MLFLRCKAAPALAIDLMPKHIWCRDAYRNPQTREPALGPVTTTSERRNGAVDMPVINDLPRFAYLVLLLLAIGGFLIVELRARPGQTVRQALAWGLIFVGTIAVAGLWSDISQEVVPRQQMLENGRIEVPVSRTGIITSAPS